ncbi:nucleoside-diphosphate kinase [Gudongella sp. SC589]|uniref:nucleoside-diphosphate kinase n=1 Tax=Gudongella sp. SC589 TaxID=3385990 RepID=UPI003904AE5D
MEKTFVMIKPDGVRRKLIGEILSRIEKKGLLINRLEMLMPEIEMLEEHYKEHCEKGFYKDLIQFMTSGKVVAIQVGGKDSISIMRKLIGETDPACASPGTVRGDFANSKTENLIHASDSEEAAKRELKLWFGEV